MNCPIENQESAEILLAYCSRKLNPASAAILEEHIQICPACRDFARGQRAVWEALDAWEAAPVSADFDRRLYARIATEVSLWDRLLRPIRPLLTLQGLPVAAAALVVITAGLLLDRPAGPVRPNDAETSAALEAVTPDQAEPILQEMEMMQELNRLAQPQSPDSKI